MRLTLLSLLAFGVALGAQEAARTPDALAAAVQARLDRLADFQADFVQSYEGGVLRTRTTERGTVSLKRPGKMRWVYTAPERKEFVADGTRIYAYIPADRQVIISPMPDDDQTTPALLLSGRGHLTRDFVPAFTDLPATARGLTGLRLTPKGADPDYTSMTLGLEPGSLQVRFLEAEDRQGGRSTFTFSNVQENRGLTDKTFEFRIPRGVDVVNHVAPPR
ncbi:MAG: LolA family protein [Vicinamibacteria bacterium]